MERENGMHTIKQKAMTAFAQRRGGAETLPKKLKNFVSWRRHQNESRDMRKALAGVFVPFAIMEFCGLFSDNPFGPL